MKQLKNILQNIAVEHLLGNELVSIAAITFDSRKVDKNHLFVAVSGTQSDGHQFIDMAISKGASAVIVENMPKNLQPEITYVQVKDSSLVLGMLASNFYDNPSSQLKLVGITGTNGKTTTVTLLYRTFMSLGYKTGLLSTVRNYIGDKIIEATHTTPDAVQINKLMREMADAGCEYCFMEVSSHSIVQNRIAGLHFAGAIFSNITQDHLDYHKTFEEYIKAKKMFFDGLSTSAFALVNTDDRNGKIMVQNTSARINTYSLKSMSDFKCKVLESHFDGMLMNIDGTDVWTKFIGGFNAYNLLAVYSAALLLGQEKHEVLRIMSNLNAVDGRFEYIRSENGITAVVDYAHTPDALKNVLLTIQEIRTGNEQIITVVGAGGDRDTSKRPIMAKIVSEMSDKVILTSDNPRSEEPEAIINDLSQGVEAQNKRKVLAITDRREAIRAAVLFAKSGDIILIAGKGHENYQDIKGIKHHFDDKEVVREIFSQLN